MSQRPSPAGLDAAQLDSLCSLDDATRRRLYEYVANADARVTRDAASAALEIDRSLVAYHLDRLVDQGLLVASFARPEGRTGPGAGRPAKHYERADREFVVTLPPRDYQLAAELLARAIDAEPSGAARRTLDRIAGELGRTLADETTGADLFERLAQQGFEPFEDDGVIRLGNCPFHQLARQHTELVCGMNLALLSGAVEATNAPVDARLDPAEGRCCVAFVPR